MILGFFCANALSDLKCLMLFPEHLSYLAAGEPETSCSADIFTNLTLTSAKVALDLQSPKKPFTALSAVVNLV